MDDGASILVIDADRHVADPPDLIEPFVAEARRGRKVRPTTGDFHPLWGSRQLDGNLKYSRDASEYLADMDAEGVSVAVLYPTAGIQIGLVSSSADAIQITQAYNDWLGAFCGTAPNRLKGVALVPLQDGAAAAVELRRAVHQLGFVAAMLPTWVPSVNPLHHELEPLYAAADELDVPIAMHAGTPTEAMPRRFPDFLSTHAVAHPSEQMAALCSIVVGGVLERHPNLRVAFLESGIGWVPYFLERLDEHYEKLRDEVLYLKRTPSEYILGGNCYFHTEGDERGLPLAIQTLGADCILYASDYPHWDCTFPESARMIERRTDISSESKRKILGANAARLYRLDALSR